MKKILLSFFIVGMTLTFSASKASAVLVASSMVKGTIDLSTLSITTDGTATYTALSSMQHAFALNEATTVGPNESTGDWGTFNTEIATLISDGSAEGESYFDPTFVGGDSPFSILSEMYAAADSSTEGFGWGNSDSWTGISGSISGGAGGGNITITVGYSLLLDAFSTSGFNAGGYTDAILDIENDIALTSAFDDDFLTANVFDGASTGGPLTALGTLSATLFLGAGETGIFDIEVSSLSFAAIGSLPVPEPATIALLGIGLAGLGGGYLRRRIKRKKENIKSEIRN